MDFKGLSDPVVVVNKPSQKQSIFQKIKPPTTNFFKNKKFLGGAMTALLLFAVGLGVYLSQKPTQLKPQASGTGAEISIKPAQQVVFDNHEFQSDVFVNTNDLSVSAIKVKVDFDSKFQLLAVDLGTFMPLFLSEPIIASNSATFTVGSQPAKNGSGTIATLRFKSIEEATGSSYLIGFDQAGTDAVATQSGDLNVASGFHPSEITVKTESSFCSSDIDCPSNYHCPVVQQQEGVAGDPVCVPNEEEIIACNSNDPDSCPSGSFCYVSCAEQGCNTFSGFCKPIDLPKSCSKDNQCPADYVCEQVFCVTAPCNRVCTYRPSPSPTPLSSPNNRVTPGADGDANSDGLIDLQDLSVFFSKWSPASDIAAFFQIDFNDDRRINSIDYSLFKQLLNAIGVVKSLDRDLQEDVGQDG